MSENTPEFPKMPSTYNTWEREYIYQQGCLDGYRMNLSINVHAQLRSAQIEKESAEDRAKKAEIRFMNYRLGLKAIRESLVPICEDIDLIELERYIRKLLSLDTENQQYALKLRPQILRGEDDDQETALVKFTPETMDDDIPF